MATTPRSRAIEYPTSDGKPMAETQTHAQDMMDTIQTLQDYFVADPDVYVWGNLLMFYDEGDRQKHVAPDVFVAFGVPKQPPRENYLIWKEGKGPDVVIELTSKTTRAEDQKKKLVLYRDVLKVPEYFLFDPFEDYLKPSMQGHRLRRKQYVPIAPVLGRFPSVKLGLHLERDGSALRLFDPNSGRRLLTARRTAALAEAALRQTETARLLAEATLRQEEAARLLAESAPARGSAEIAVGCLGRDGAWAASSGGPGAARSGSGTSSSRAAARASFQGRAGRGSRGTQG